MSTSPSSSAKEAQKALGARLREIRKDAGLSGRALAAALAASLCALLGPPVSAQTSAQASGNTATTAEAKEANAAFHAGYAAANAGDLEKARRSFAEVVRLEPKIPEGHAALGSVLLNLGRPAEAAVELKRGLALRPTDANTASVSRGDRHRRSRTSTSGPSAARNSAAARASWTWRP